MMHSHAFPLLFAVVAALSLGWTPLMGLAQPTPAAAACDRCGKVESIRAVANKDQWTPLGSSVPRSSDLGPTGVAVYQIGPGFSNQGQVLIGAAGGGVYQTRAKQRNDSRWEIVVKMDDGSARSIIQNYEPLLVVGDRVRVIGTQIELVQ
jgi:outer membrane lipoprotein SlyB